MLIKISTFILLLTFGFSAGHSDEADRMVITGTAKIWISLGSKDDRSPSGYLEICIIKPDIYIGQSIKDLAIWAPDRFITSDGQLIEDGDVIEFEAPIKLFKDNKNELNKFGLLKAVRIVQKAPTSFPDDKEKTSSEKKDQSWRKVHTDPRLLPSPPGWPTDNPKPPPINK